MPTGQNYTTLLKIIRSSLGLIRWFDLLLTLGIVLVTQLDLNLWGINPSDTLTLSQHKLATLINLEEPTLHKIPCCMHA